MEVWFQIEAIHLTITTINYTDHPFLQGTWYSQGVFGRPSRLILPRERPVSDWWWLFGFVGWLNGCLVGCLVWWLVSWFESPTADWHKGEHVPSIEDGWLRGYKPSALSRSLSLQIGRKTLLCKLSFKTFGCFIIFMNAHRFVHICIWIIANCLPTF